MLFKWRKWDFWKSAKKLAEARMTRAWMEGGNCDSCCANCKLWESKGNHIETLSNDDGSDTRTCSNCGNKWKAIYTPAGFLPID